MTNKPYPLLLPFPFFSDALWDFLKVFLASGVEYREELWLAFICFNNRNYVFFCFLEREFLLHNKFYVYVSRLWIIIKTKVRLSLISTKIFAMWISLSGFPEWHHTDNLWYFSNSYKSYFTLASPNLRPQLLVLLFPRQQLGQCKLTNPCLHFVLFILKTGQNTHERMHAQAQEVTQRHSVYIHILVQPKMRPHLTAESHWNLLPSCCTVPLATAGTLFTFCLVYFQNWTEYASTHARTNIRSDIAFIYMVWFIF